MRTTDEYIQLANKYIDDVLSGKISACTYVKQACKRQRDDLKRKNFSYHFDLNRAAKPCKFIECLKHVKGPIAGQNITLEPWQIFIITTVFGWIDNEGNRRYQRVYIEVPRGNGKSCLSSGIGLYGLCADNEAGAEIYSLATTREQARIVFDDAQVMARKSFELIEAYGLTVLKNSIISLGSNSKFTTCSAEAKNLDGLKTHIGIIDELHAHQTRDVYDVIETSIGKRLQPLLWCITTAGINLTGICMEIHRYVSKILNKTIKDDLQFGIIYTIDKKDAWDSETALIKANPNWGVSVIPKTILANLAKAKAEPSAENNFKTKHLNVWCNANSAWLDMTKWRRNYRNLDIKDFEGKYCIYGIDLASKIDIAAVIKTFWDYEDDGRIHYYTFTDLWLPSETLYKSKNSQYVGWAKQGYFHVSEGPVIDLRAIEDFIAEDFLKYETLALGFDPWQATQLAQNLLSRGAPMIEISANVKNFSEPMKHLQALIYQGLYHTNNDPVLEWTAANVVCHLDAKDNIYPRKELPENKIDPIVAMILAMHQVIQLDVENQYTGEPVSIADLIF